jgi:hypothetical protein
MMKTTNLSNNLSSKIESPSIETLLKLHSKLNQLRNLISDFNQKTAKIIQL